MDGDPGNTLDETAQELLRGDENEAKEYKSTDVLREPDGKHKHEIAKQLVAFSNNGGGYVLFGVNDHAEIDSGKLDEELSLGTISKIARMKCSPPVDFSYEYHPRSEVEEQRGDLFILKVEPRRAMPHAIVENSDGEIRSREYRLRAGDESRLVTDDELYWLFENRLTDLGDVHNYRTWYLLGKEYEPVVHHLEEYPPVVQNSNGPEVPQGSKYLHYFVNEGPEFEEEIEEFGFPIRLPTYLVDVCPFAILASIGEHLSNSWRIEWEKKGDFGPKTMSVEDERTTSITTDDINVHEEGAILSHLDIDVFELLEEIHHSDTSYEVVAPEGTAIEVELPEPLPEEHALAFVESTVTIANGEMFEFEIRTGMSMSGRSYPYGHPETLRQGSVRPSSGLISTEINIEMDTSFGVPEIRDPNLDEHQDFAHSLHEVLSNEWDADEYLQTRQENLLFEIDGKVNNLLDAMEEDEKEEKSH